MSKPSAWQACTISRLHVSRGNEPSMRGMPHFLVVAHKIRAMEALFSMYRLYEKHPLSPTIIGIAFIVWQE